MSHAQTMLDATPMAGSPGVINLGAVDYLNTLPLIAGLEGLESICIRSDVPANQITMLEDDLVDLALCSSIDILRSRTPLMVVPVGMLGCNGPTLTVRLFSSVPFEEISCVHCDQESHTSVQLLRILLHECHGIDPTFIEFDTGAVLDSKIDPVNAEAVLLIGDKVVTSELPQNLRAYQLDLGEAWHDMTGMPFVFATWLARADRSDEERERIRLAACILNRTRLRNRFRIDQIVAEHAPRHGWPIDLARRYLGECLQYDLDSRARAGLHRFLEMAGGSKDCVHLLDGI